MRKTNKIGYFIISNGRPSEQLTYDLLKSSNVNMDDVYIVCDDLDETLPEYIKNYGDRVVVFNKQHYIDTCDSGVQHPTGLHSVYARNAAQDIAKEKGYEFFAISDDDIKALHHRIIENGKLKAYIVKDINKCLLSYIEFMKCSTHISCLGFGTNNTFIGGVNSKVFRQGFEYMAVNMALYRNDVKLNYSSECQEDLIASMLNNSIGKLIISPPFIMVDAIVKGRNNGGNAGCYDKENMYNTYFGTLIYVPASIRISSNIDKLTKINKGNYYPMILSDRWKK